MISICPPSGGRAKSAGLTGFGCGAHDRRAMRALLFSAALHLAATAPALAAPPLAERIADWPGLENVGRVAPGLYRGGTPTTLGFDTLKAKGVKTVVSLRHYHFQEESLRCRERGIDFIHLPVPSSQTPRDQDVTRFLEIVTDPARQPVYFHCWRGKDRTGVFCASYRMAVSGWSKEDAIQEMDAFGFYKGWKDLRRYIDGFPDRQAAVWPAGAARPASSAPR
jgi:protein tyrosine phosphatase (PTP) superfamily phosphohydrolase (DUF442 family)